MSTAKSAELAKLTSLDALEQAAECLKTLAHPHRLRMVQMLLQGPLYGRGTGRGVRYSQPHGVGTSAAHATLRLSDQRERGRKAYYQIAETHLANIMACIEARFGDKKLRFF